MRASMWTERRNDTTGRFVIAKTNGGSFRPVGQRNDGVMVLLRGLAAFITTIPWPTLRRCQHKWSPRTYPWACEHCGAARR